MNLHRCYPQKGSLNLHLWTAATGRGSDAGHFLGEHRRQPSILQREMGHGGCPFTAVHPPSPCVGLSRRQSRTTETAAVSLLPLTHLQRGKTLPRNAIPNVLCRRAKLSTGTYGRLHSSIPNAPWRQQKRRNGIPSKSLWKASIPNRLTLDSLIIKQGMTCGKG